LQNGWASTCGRIKAELTESEGPSSLMIGGEVRSYC
jgi:hypothetical protein